MLLGLNKCLSFFSPAVVIKDPDESNLGGRRIWLTIPGYQEVSWWQQAPEGAGQHASAVDKQKAVNAQLASSIFTVQGPSQLMVPPTVSGSSHLD